jgi:hypothetical protein
MDDLPGRDARRVICEDVTMPAATKENEMRDRTLAALAALVEAVGDHFDMDAIGTKLAHAMVEAQDVLSRAPAVADAAPTGTEAYTRELEERLSEVVAPKLADGSEWMETLPDGSVVPVMRGSPKLPAFIAKLHQAAADAQRERDELLAAAAPTGEQV